MLHVKPKTDLSAKIFLCNKFFNLTKNLNFFLCIAIIFTFLLMDRTFALSMCNKMSDMIQGLTTPAHMKLQLIPILQHMHHDTSTAAMVRNCLSTLVTVRN